MSLYDANVRHAIYIERYKSRVATEIIRIINGLTGDLYRRLSASDLEQLSRRDLDRLLAEVNRLINSAYGPIVSEIDDALREFVVYEAGWQATALRRGGLVADIGVPSDADLWAAMYSRPFQGSLLRDWLRDLPQQTAARVRATIRQGYTDGLGALEIARQIRGTRARPGVMDTSRRGAETMVRTAVAHTASRARDLTYRESGVAREQWVSVLDARTSSICRSRDGNIYDVGKGPRPPAHPNCRGTMIPVTSGNRAALEARPTYNDWLTRQPASVQDDILGPTRGRLFRSGEYPVDRFTDRAGQEYTLEQLRAKDAETFDEVLGDE
jgi:SPP1 gp7 family putative phage head morphogenesis protein